MIIRTIALTFPKKVPELHHCWWLSVFSDETIYDKFYENNQHRTPDQRGELGAWTWVLRAGR